MAHIQITHGAHTYSATLSRDPEAGITYISIDQDDHWAGRGRVLPSGRIDDCAAQLGDRDESEDVYAALEAAIDDVFQRGVCAEMDPSGEAEA